MSEMFKLRVSNLVKIFGGTPKRVNVCTGCLKAGKIQKP